MALPRRYKSVHHKSSSLWDFMKKSIDYVEIDSIQEFVGNNVISNNQILLNEVYSLKDILNEMNQRSSTLAENEKHQGENSYHYKKVPSLQEWNRDLIITQIGDLLHELGENGTKILDSLPHADLTTYFLVVKERGGNLKYDDDDDNTTEHSSKLKLKSPNSKTLDAADYYTEISRIRKKLNVFDILDILPIILNAFSDEEAALKVEAEYLRNFIDAKTCSNDDSVEIETRDRVSLDAIIKLQSSIERIQEEKDLINRSEEERKLPPLNSTGEDASTIVSSGTSAALSQMHNPPTSRAVRHVIDSNCNTSLDQPQQNGSSKSKKWMKLRQAIDDAKKLQASNVLL